MPQVIQPPGKQRRAAKTALVNAPAKATHFGVVPPTKKAAARKSAPKSHAVNKVAKIVRGVEALQLLVDAGILTASGNARRRFK